MTGRSGFFALAGLLAACSPRPAGAVPESCAPTDAQLGAGASAAGLLGEYRVRLVATSGPRRDSATDGTLGFLEPPDTVASAPRRYRLRGYGDLRLEEVGAPPADVGSRLPTRPGALVFELSGSGGPPPRLLVRLGAEANRQDVTRVEGAYTVLTVRELREDGFAGEWSSGAPLPVAGGYFCAWRADTAHAAGE